MLLNVIKIKLRLEKFFNNTRFARGNKDYVEKLFELRKLIDEIIDNRLVAINKGIHPKHFLTDYHEFFLQNILENETVLDIGCGNGFLDYDIASKKNIKLIGVEMSGENIKFARKFHNHQNIIYVNKNIFHFKSEGRVDCVMMSNVLEHIKERVKLIKMINKEFKPKKWLIRVPMVDRDWQTIYLKDNGLEYRLDDTHEIEYTKEAFINEMKKAGLKIDSIDIKWGEIYSILSV
jgi:2-polyprenyl-3-methyl-5-hydroxy-6-metoxy-1,4-benzoquinol methylase